jgi:hypothetical protein
MLVTRIYPHGHNGYMLITLRFSTCYPQVIHRVIHRMKAGYPQVKHEKRRFQRGEGARSAPDGGGRSHAAQPDGAACTPRRGPQRRRGRPPGARDGARLLQAQGCAQVFARQGWRAVSLWPGMALRRPGMAAVPGGGRPWRGGGGWGEAGGPGDGGARVGWRRRGRQGWRPMMAAGMPPYLRRGLRRAPPHNARYQMLRNLRRHRVGR